MVYSGSKELPMKKSRGRVVSHFGYECDIYIPPSTLLNGKEVSVTCQGGGHLWHPQDNSNMEEMAATHLSAWLSLLIYCLFIIFTAFGFHFYQILESLYSEQFHSIW